MSLPLYTDHHIQSAIITGLRRGGIEVPTTQEEGTGRLEDELLLERAVALNRILLTEDKDFFRIAARWWSQGRDFPGIIHVDQDGARVGKLIEDIMLIVMLSSAEEMRNQIQWVPLSRS